MITYIVVFTLSTLLSVTGLWWSPFTKHEKTEWQEILAPVLIGVGLGAAAVTLAILLSPGG